MDQFIFRIDSSVLIFLVLCNLNGVFHQAISPCSDGVGKSSSESLFLA